MFVLPLSINLFSFVVLISNTLGQIFHYLNYLYQYLSFCPAAAVEVAVADGFGEMFGLDVFTAVEVGYGADDL